MSYQGQARRGQQALSRIGAKRTIILSDLRPPRDSMRSIQFKPARCIISQFNK